MSSFRFRVAFASRSSIVRMSINYTHNTRSGFQSVTEQSPLKTCRRLDKNRRRVCHFMRPQGVSLIASLSNLRIRRGYRELSPRRRQSKHPTKPECMLLLYLSSVYHTKLDKRTAALLPLPWAPTCFRLPHNNCVLCVFFR